MGIMMTIHAVIPVFCQIVRHIGLVTDRVGITMPVFGLLARIQRAQDRILNIHHLTFKFGAVRTIQFECTRNHLVFTDRYLILQTDVLIPYLAIIVGLGDSVVQNDMASVDGRHIMPRAIRKTFVCESILYVIRNHLRIIVVRGVDHGVHLDHIAILHVAGGCINLNIIQIRELNHLHRLGRAREPVLATIYHVEIPHPARQRIYRVILMIIISVLIRAAVLLSIENHRAQIPGSFMIDHIDGVRKPSVFHFELHTPQIHTTQCRMETQVITRIVGH